MARTEADRMLELEESAQGVDLYRAPGSELQLQMAAEEAGDEAGFVEQHPSAVLARAQARRHGLRGAMIDSEKAVAGPSGRTTDGT